MKFRGSNVSVSLPRSEKNWHVLVCCLLAERWDGDVLDKHWKLKPRSKSCHLVSSSWYFFCPFSTLWAARQYTTQQNHAVFYPAVTLFGCVCKCLGSVWANRRRVGEVSGSLRAAWGPGPLPGTLAACKHQTILSPGETLTSRTEESSP